MKGFSLIEMIGVLAVMAILAAVIAPPVIQEINRAKADSETQNLVSMSKELEEYIRAKKIIPSAAGWVKAVASESTVQESKIKSNNSGFTRGYYVDPHFFTGTNKTFSAYVQNAGLTTAPVSPRIMIVSSLTANAPAPPTTFSVFDATWNQTAGKLVTESANVKIQRIHLGFLFHRVLLTNQSATLTPSYRIEAGTKTSVPAGSPGQLTRYVLDGSKLSLFLDTGSLNYALLVREDESLLYGTDGSKWFWGRP